jgi:hypothetical protein
MKLSARSSNVLLVCAVLALLGNCDSYNLSFDKFLNGSPDAVPGEGTPDAIPDDGTPPVLTGTVSIAGTPVPGQTLTADTSSLDGSGTISYQWGWSDTLAGPFTDILAATAAAYTLTAADNGKYIVVTVTRADNSGSVRSSPGLGPVGLPLLTGTVTITGTPEVGQLLSAATSLGGSGTISYQWQRGAASAGPFTDIAAATAAAYTLTAADNGKYIVVMVTRTDNSGYLISPAVGPVTSFALNNVADIAAWIAAVVAEDPSAGFDADHPIPLLLDIGLAADWTNLLTAIDAASKYVSLDLSACGMMSGTFNPGAANTGEKYVTALTLPDAATSIAAGPSGNSTFRYFSNLREINGEQVTTIGQYAFYNCTSLTSATFPVVTTIGHQAFSSCTSLTSVTLPASLSNIYGSAFGGCTGLTNISVDAGNPNFSASGGMLMNKAGTTLIAWPSASGSVTLDDITTIGDYAFGLCYSLTSVTLHAATTIGFQAFFSCTSLTSVTLPEATTIGNQVFAHITGGQALTITLGATPPTLGTDMFDYTGKPVTVNVPSAAFSAYEPVPVNTTDNNWGNAFRGKGWDGSIYLIGTVNGSVSLAFTTY